MRIALFTECYRPIVNGVVISVATFAGELRRQGHEVQIIAPAYPGYADTDSDVHRLPSISPPTNPRYPLAIPHTGYRLKPLFEEHPPDIIHVQHPFMCCREGRRWARRLGCPLIFTYHTLIRAYAHYVPLPQVLVRAAAVRVSRDFSNSVDRVIVPTRAIADVLRDYGVRTPIDAIPTGIDLDLVRSAQKNPVRTGLGIPTDIALVTFSGRIALEKNLETLIRAFASIVRDGSHAHLLLIGGGPWEGEARRLALSERVAERIHFTGYLEREDLFDWLADSDVYAFPSLTDTQGVAVLEAMALGCPPVAIRSGAVEDVIRDGVDGLMTEPTVESLAEGLTKVLTDDSLRHQLAGHARLRAEQFSAASMAQRLARVYEEALSG